jgi:hypothetical protein
MHIEGVNGLTVGALGRISAHEKGRGPKGPARLSTSWAFVVGSTSAPRLRAVCGGGSGRGGRGPPGRRRTRPVPRPAPPCPPCPPRSPPALASYRKPLRAGPAGQDRPGRAYSLGYYAPGRGVLRGGPWGVGPEPRGQQNGPAPPPRSAGPSLARIVSEGCGFRPCTFWAIPAARVRARRSPADLGGG